MAATYPAPLLPGTHTAAEITEWLRTRLPSLSALYLFGSVAAGQQHAASDLDLAVLYDGAPLEPLARWQLATQLAATIHCDVDLVDLRTADTVLQYQVISTGVPLWTRDASAEVYACFILSEKTRFDEARAPLLEDIIARGSVTGASVAHADPTTPPP
jgi:predicted nucleotidyltransferase